MDYYIQLPQTKLKSKYRVGIVMPIYNRPNYLRKCFASLKASSLRDAIVILIDDASDDQEAKQLIKQFSHADAPVIRLLRITRRDASVYFTLPDNITSAFNYLDCCFSCDYFCILDSDTVMTPDWLEKLCELYEYWARTGTGIEASPAIVSGFNTLNHINIKKGEGKFIYKASLGGINMLFKPSLYREVFLPVEDEWDIRIVKKMRQKGYQMLCTDPSVIQHIGEFGAFSKQFPYVDWAFDYNVSPSRARLNKQVHIMLHWLWQWQAVRWLWQWQAVRWALKGLRWIWKAVDWTWKEPRWLWRKLRPRKITTNIKSA